MEVKLKVMVSREVGWIWKQHVCSTMCFMWAYVRWIFVVFFPVNIKKTTIGIKMCFPYSCPWLRGVCGPLLRLLWFASDDQPWKKKFGLSPFILTAISDTILPLRGSTAALFIPWRNYGHCSFIPCPHSINHRTSSAHTDAFSGNLRNSRVHLKGFCVAWQTARYCYLI